MALNCLTLTCTGKVYTGRRGRQFYWEGETYSCRKCGREYVAAVTDDYEDDRIPYLVPKDEGCAVLASQGGAVTRLDWPKEET